MRVYRHAFKPTISLCDCLPFISCSPKKREMLNSKHKNVPLGDTKFISCSPKKRGMLNSKPKNVPLGDTNLGKFFTYTILKIMYKCLKNETQELTGGNMNFFHLKYVEETHCLLCSTNSLLTELTKKYQWYDTRKTCHTGKTHIKCVFFVAGNTFCSWKDMPGEIIGFTTLNDKHRACHC